VQADHDWYRNFELDVARYRGLDNLDDHLHAGTFRVELRMGESVTLVVTTDASAGLDGEAAWGRRLDHERRLLARKKKADPPRSPDTPAWVRQLVLAADQFVVGRPLPDDPDAHSLIAGYHWFGDWGRDPDDGPHRDCSFHSANFFSFRRPRNAS
jgi:glycogen debranching enzyme